MKSSAALCLALAALALATACQSQAPAEAGALSHEKEPPAAERGPDPWEGFNRRMMKFNDALDVVFVPIAKGYRKAVPTPLRRGFNNFTDNLGDVNDLLNNLLQGKIKRSLSDFGRILINTTIGLGGLFDPASRMGLKDHDEDFGQTLASWGVPPGPYIVLPFLGPSTLRDVFTFIPDTYADPAAYLQPTPHRNALVGVRLVNLRSELLSVEQSIFGDRYIFIRDAYLQRREFLVNDGVVEDDPFGDDF